MSTLNIQRRSASAGSLKVKTGKIVLFGNPSLREVCEQVNVFHKNLHTKIDLVKNSLESHGGGAALAAPQISLSKRFTVIHYLGEYLELINPEIVDSRGEVEKYEGCLSLPGYFGKVIRAQTVTVRYSDRFGRTHAIERSDDMARCLQHEIDHLDGVLFIDRMTEEFVFKGDDEARLEVKALIELTHSKVEKSAEAQR